MKKRLLLTRRLNLRKETEDKLARELDIIVSPGAAERDILPLVADVHGIVAHGARVTEKIIQSAPLLEVIATPQVGFDSIDVAAATRAGVAVVANTGLAPDTVAEFTLGLMIALARRIVKSDRDLRRERDWSVRAAYVDPARDIGKDLQGATIGLVGFGSIGSSVARLCRRTFSARVLAYDPFVPPEKMSPQGVEKRDNLADMAREVDFLSLHVALTDATRHLIDETILRAMMPGAYLINCARGEVVDEKALTKAIKNRWIAGAATDVLEEEPVDPGNPLLDLSNVIITPHIAGITAQSSFQRGEEVVRQILEVFSRTKPKGLANPDVWPEYLEKSKKGS
jgi:D-3-phosphoglycerate dehydrogenase / 2-oxoglutarate reductase